MATAGGLTLPAWLSAMRDDDRTGEAFPWEKVLLARLEQARERLDRERAEAPASSRSCCPARREPGGAGRARSAFPDLGGLRGAAAAELPGGATPARRAGSPGSPSPPPRPRRAAQEPLVRDLEARAWACLGAARLRAGDLAGAEEALREGAFCLVDGTGDLLVDARLLEFEAAVREAQGGLRAAASLLRQAEARYREIGETTLAARAGQDARAPPARPESGLNPGGSG